MNNNPNLVYAQTISDLNSALSTEAQKVVTKTVACIENSVEDPKARARLIKSLTRRVSESLNYVLRILQHSVPQALPEDADFVVKEPKIQENNEKEVQEIKQLELALLAEQERCAMLKLSIENAKLNIEAAKKHYEVICMSEDTSKIDEFFQSLNLSS
jgi:predicted O-linked N-acetylglucosamine transferase (SPINDLY family)